jgi:hypothetical protein
VVAAEPPLPKVEITRRDRGEEALNPPKGYLVAHSDGFWHLFNEKNQLLSNPDDEVSSVRVIGGGRGAPSLVAEDLRPIAPSRLPTGARLWKSCGCVHQLPTNVCDQRASTIPHIYPSVLQAVPGRGYAGCLEGVILGVSGWGYARSWI